MEVKSGELSEQDLWDILPLYYNRLFPYSTFYKWLSYGSEKYFCRRELSFTLLDDVYLRFQSFEDEKQFIGEMQNAKPIKIDIGAVYSASLQRGHYMRREIVPQEKELVFDIDMTDYDDTRTCCSGADICMKCWKFMTIACKIIDSSLREWFNFKHIMWVFSGRRGIHCWVCDDHVRKLDDVARTGIADFLEVRSGGAQKHKKVHIYGDKLHSHIKKSLAIIKPYFNDLMLKDQDILGNDERLKSFLLLINSDIRDSVEKAIRKFDTSEDRWKAFVEHRTYLVQNQMLPKNRYIVEEVMLEWCYPRLDINVTKGLNHLLKAPFCVHPKTGKISIPFSAKLVDKFDPINAPNIRTLVAEINAYDKKTKEQEQETVDEDDFVQQTNYSAIKDYKKTSLLKPVATFDELVRGLEHDRKSNTSIQLNIEEF